MSVHNIIISIFFWKRVYINKLIVSLSCVLYNDFKNTLRNAPTRVYRLILFGQHRVFK